MLTDKKRDENGALRQVMGQRDEEEPAEKTERSGKWRKTERA